MTTKLTTRREVETDGEPVTLPISADGLKLVRKGRRNVTRSPGATSRAPTGGSTLRSATIRRSAALERPMCNSCTSV